MATLNALLVGAVSLWVCSASAQVGTSPHRSAPSATNDTTNKKKVQEAQHRLHILGYDPGSENGDMDTNTINALKQYQDDLGFPANGILDSLTLANLRNPIELSGPPFIQLTDPPGRVIISRKDGKHQCYSTIKDPDTHHILRNILISCGKDANLVPNGKASDR